MKIRIRLINEPSDCEKLVLPSIVYIHKKEVGVKVYWVGIGWWHYGISIAFIIKAKNR